MEKPNSVLVLAAGSLGDALLTLPALRALQSRSNITVAGTPSYLELGTKLLGVDQVIPLDPLLQILFSSDPKDSQKDFWAQFSEIFVFFKDKDELILENLALLSGAKIHFPAKPFSEFLKEARWAAEYWLETAFECPLSADSPFRQAKLQIDEAVQKKGREILDSLKLKSPLVIHPGSGSPAKNAPLSFFRDAAERATRESQKQVLIVWGEAERKELEPIRQTFKGIKDVEVLPAILPMPDLAGVFSQSAAFLGNDSGVTHMASACGLRTFAVFQSTDSRVWGPQQAIILAAMKNLYS